MNWQIVKTLLLHELRMLIRDRRSVILSLVLPLVIMPTILFGTRFMNDRREQKLDDTVYRYAIIGTGADALRGLIVRAQDLVERTKAGGERDALSGFRREEFPAADPDTLLKSQELHFYLEALTSEQADLLDAMGDTTGSDSRESDSPGMITEIRYPGVPVVNMYFLANRDASRVGQQKMWELLREIRDEDRSILLQQSGLNVQREEIVPVARNDIATASQISGSAIGRFLPMFLVFLMLTGGSVVAMDSIAGEKERGSLETLLTTAASRVEIVSAKQLAVLVVALLITLIQVLNLLCYVSFQVIRLTEDFSIALSPVTVAIVFILFVPVAAFTSSVLLMISAYAKSYKETQFYFFPVFLTISVLMASALLPGISLQSAIVLVPLANVSVAVREIFVGTFNWPMLLITFVVMSAAALLTGRSSARMLSMERLVVTGDMDQADLSGGEALFSKRVLVWYALIWAVMFAVATNIPLEDAFVTQLIFNEFVLFVGIPLVIIWKYRLPLKEALALRAPKPIVWPVILLMVPATQLAGTAVFMLASLVFPVPEKLLEEFGRNILPEEIPIWQLLIYIGILPGICEEIGFRGPLLYGLRRRFPPITVMLVVGLIFGLFHMELFRIIPTGFLGIIITGVALLTGSIFPGMVLHAANNISAVAMAKMGVSMGALEWWYYGLGVVAFVGCVMLLYRNRTPYPEPK